MKRIAFLLLAFVLLSQFESFSQPLGISSNGKYIPFYHRGVAYMINDDGKVLYPVPNKTIGFTPDEKHFYYCVDNVAHIHESATGKEVKKMNVKGTLRLMIDNDLKRYCYFTRENEYNDYASSLNFVKNPNESPVVHKGVLYKAYKPYRYKYYDISYEHNLAVFKTEEGYFLIKLDNPQNVVKLKVKKPRTCDIENTTGKIYIGSYEDKAYVFDKNGEQIEKLKAYDAHELHAVAGKWYLNGYKIYNFGPVQNQNISQRADIENGFISDDGKYVISTNQLLIEYFDIEQLKSTKLLYVDKILTDPQNELIVSAAKKEAIVNSDKHHTIHTFKKGETSPFQVDGEWTMVKGNKYLFSCGQDNTSRYVAKMDLENFKNEGNFRIEAGVKYLAGRDPFFGIFNEYRNAVKNYIAVTTVAKSANIFTKTKYDHQDTKFSYAANPGMERNIVVIEEEKGKTRLYVNGEEVGSTTKASLNPQYGFLIYNSGLAEADYIMISNIRDDDFYKHWRTKAGLNIDPVMTADFQGHAGVITDIKVSPDGKEIVTCAKDKTIRVWDIKTGQNIRTFRTSFGKGDNGICHRIAISPDKKYIAAGGIFSGPEGYEMGHIRFLDYETGKVVHVYDRLDASIHCLEFSPPTIPFKEQMLLVGSSDGENHFFRYHYFKKNLERAYLSPDYKKIDAQMEKTWVKEARFNPKHDEFLIVMDHWKFVRTFNLNHSELGEGTSELEIKGDEEVTSACYSVGGDSIIIVYQSKIDVFDLKGNKIGNIPAKQFPTDYRVFALPDGENIIMRNVIYNIKTGEKTVLKTGNLMPSKEGIVTPDGLYAVAGYTYDNPQKQSGLNYSAPQEIGLFDIKTNKQITQLKSKASRFEGIAFAPNNMGIVFTQNYSGLEGAKTFQKEDILNYFDYEKLNIIDYEGKPVSNNLVYEFEGKKLERWGVENGKEDLGKLRYGNVAIRENTDYTAVVSYTLTPDGNVIVGTNFSLLMFDKEGKKIVDFLGHTGGVKALALSNNGKQLLSLGQDRTVKLWDISKILPVIEPTATLVVSDENDWICVDRSNYYASSRYGVKYLGFLQDRGTYTEADFYPFDQFDLIYNRPDILLTTLGVPNEELKKAYNNAYVKRLKKYGGKSVLGQEYKRKPYILEMSPGKVFDTLSAPFMVKGCDGNSKAKFSHFNFWINDVQVFRTQPKTKNNEATFNTNFRLVPGKNVITVQPVNQKGVLGMKKQVTYYADVEPPKPNLYIVSIGVSEYADASMNLNYAAKDAEDVVNQLKASKCFGEVKSALITNSNATRKNILAAKKMLKEAKPWDVTVVFLAGHGLLSDNLDWYFATSDVDFNAPEAKGLEYSVIEQLFDSIPSRNRLLLLDACHSGEVDKESMSIGEGAMAQNVGARGFKSVKKPKLGLENSFALMQNTFANLERGTGALVISSAGGAEFAFESSEWKNGVFTYALLEGLKTGNADADKNGEIVVSELRDYVFYRVKKLTNGQQNPTSRRENLEFDFRVW